LLQKAEKEIEAGLYRLLPVCVWSPCTRKDTILRSLLQLRVDADAQGDGDLDIPDQEELARQWKGRVLLLPLFCHVLYSTCDYFPDLEISPSSCSHVMFVCCNHPLNIQALESLMRNEFVISLIAQYWPWY
jgi:hypothetical protein